MPAKAVKSLLLVCLLALAIPVTGASAKTVVKTVPGEVVFLDEQKPGFPGNCSAVAFVQWADVPGTTQATVFWTANGIERSESAKSPFHDTLDFVAVYTAPAGFHWINVAYTSAHGPVANTCEEFTAKHKQAISNTVARVELTVEIDPAVCASAQAKLAAQGKSVTKLTSKLKKAKTKKAKKKLRSKTKTAKAKSAEATKLVSEVC